MLIVILNYSITYSNMTINCKYIFTKPKSCKPYFNMYNSVTNLGLPTNYHLLLTNCKYLH